MTGCMRPGAFGGISAPGPGVGAAFHGLAAPGPFRGKPFGGLATPGPFKSTVLTYGSASTFAEDITPARVVIGGLLLATVWSLYRQ